MSGLFGALSVTGRPLAPDLGARMAQSLSAQPADTEGYRTDGSVLLGARTAWFTREDATYQPPFVDATSGHWGLFDGRLDGRSQTAQQLGLSDAANLPDAALAVAAYRRWGAAFAARLRGDFAIVIWDPAQRQLTLARDPLGVRPLYWARTRDVFAFASRPRPLFCLDELSQEFDALRIAQYLTIEFADTERSFYRAVRRLSPGHVLRVAVGAEPVEPSRYFSFRSERELPRQSNAEYAAEFRSLFLDAVRERTRTADRLGCLLSGGLDSSGLFGALRVLAPERPIACFSARFQDFPEIDEGPWLDQLEQSWPGAPRTEFRADRVGPLDGIDALHAALDEPFHAPNLFIYDGLARLAQAAGARVLLDGLDGDTVVDHGYGYLRQLLFAGRPRRLWRALSDLHARMGLSYRSLLRDFVFEPELHKLTQYLVRQRLLRRGYLRRDFEAASGLWAARLERALPTPRSLRDGHLLALTHPILPFYLEAHDKAAAALGIEHRHPYFDIPLMEFCLALPPEQRLHAGWDRVVQRRAFEGLAPESIRSRQSKSVWTPNFARQLFGPAETGGSASSGGHAVRSSLARPRARFDDARLRHLFESGDSPLRPYCDLERLRRDAASLRNGRAQERLVEVWCAISLGCWLEQKQPAV